MTHSRIAGTGSYLPSRLVTNADLEKMVETSDEWIRTRTGIERRHLAAPEETSSVLAEHAARRALRSAGLTVEDVDFIVVGTTTPDLVFPNTGTLLQQRLGIHNCPAFALETACSGFIYALSVADKFVRAGEVKCALVVGTECLSRIVDWNDRGTCVLFGDGAGAVVLTPSTEPGIIATHLHSDGKYQDLLKFPFGPSSGFDQLRAGVPAGITMQGNEVFKVAVRTLSRLVDETLAKNGIDKHQIDWLVPHQANIRIIMTTAQKLGVPPERVVVTVERQGNTSAASVPLALDAAVRDGRIQPGHLVMLEAVGGGMTWGSALLRW